MGYDHSIFSELDTLKPRCPRCQGRSYTLYERDNPRTAEPCGCDAPDEEDASDDEGHEARLDIEWVSGIPEYEERRSRGWYVVNRGTEESKGPFWTRSDAEYAAGRDPDDAGD